MCLQACSSTLGLSSTTSQRTSSTTAMSSRDLFTNCRRRSPICMNASLSDYSSRTDPFFSYHKILTQILARLDPRSVDRIKTILSWIAFARRPLKRFELLSAVSFSLGDPNVERPAPQYILDICSPLVGERRDTTLVFIHVSVKE